jgi:hypothetical protein
MSLIPPCTVYGTQQEYDEYEPGSLSAMVPGWNAYIAQQCQRNHGVRMARYADQIGNCKAHLFCMYTDPDYWYMHYCFELRINSLFNHEVFLIKAMTKGNFLMHVCMSKIGVHRRNFLATSGLYSHPPLEHPMMTSLQSHVLNIPWIMDDVFLCSPVPNEQLTNEWRGPPESRLGRAAGGGSGSLQADIKISTRLPIQEGCLHRDPSCIGNGQSGERTDSPGK